MWRVLLFPLMFSVGYVLAGCSKNKDAPPREVVVYTSLDEIYSEPILAEFQRQTGIKPLPVYDAEVAKTTGLVNRLISRRDNPDCDVLWSNEIVQTQRLAEMGILAAYASPQAERIPPQYRDKQGRWTGFAARARVILYNTKLVAPDEAPKGLDDLAAPKWRGKVAIARPFFGTTLTHMAALHQAWGKDRLAGFLDALRANDVALCAGNAAVRDLVAAGERALGLTDTDDAYAALQAGKPVKIVIPDAEGGMLLIPNTVALVARCPHPAEGRKLIDYLLSRQVELALARSASAQIPLGDDLQDVQTPWTEILGPKFMQSTLKYDVVAAAASQDDVVSLLKLKGMDQ